jgi:hypothetical protein
MEFKTASRHALVRQPAGIPLSRREWLWSTLRPATLGALAAALFFRKSSAAPIACVANPNALDQPPIAKNAAAVEVLRVWALPGEKQQIVLKATWKEPGAWGLLLADVAGHAANAFAEDGHNRTEAFNRIIEFLNAELAKPTDLPKKL